MQGAGYLTEARSPVTGLEIKPNLDTNQFDVLFAGMAISFRFLVLYGADDLLTGNVVVVRNSPSFCDKADVIGRFSFDRQGITDFENSNGSKLEIEYIAADIVLHYLVQALRKELPNTLPLA